MYRYTLYCGPYFGGIGIGVSSISGPSGKINLDIPYGPGCLTLVNNRLILTDAAGVQRMTVWPEGIVAYFMPAVEEEWTYTARQLHNWSGGAIVDSHIYRLGDGVHDYSIGLPAQPGDNYLAAGGLTFCINCEGTTGVGNGDPRFVDVMHDGEINDIATDNAGTKGQWVNLPPLVGGTPGVGHIDALPVPGRAVGILIRDCAGAWPIDTAGIFVKHVWG